MKRGFIIDLRMLKWVTSLLLFIALTGQVWAGVCACFDDHNDSHSCCKPDKSGKDSLSTPPCCSDDCESIAGSQIPGKSTDRVLQDSQVKQIAPEPRVYFRFEEPIIRPRSAPSSNLLGNRLKLARPPDALYLRHNSFLI